ncbi:MAG: hypothetical protein IKO47_08075 [Ruminococcus sp.]|nr:hypothetical protein [Ruminococcus sp.]
MRWIAYHVPGWTLFLALGLLLGLSAVYMIKDARAQKKSMIGGTAVLLVGIAFAAAAVLLLVSGKSGSFGSYF